MHPPTLFAPEQLTGLPDHTQLPDNDGAIVVNTQEHPQSNMLTDSMMPRLRVLHPDGQFCVCSDVGIYWRFVEPVLDGCKAPDWFYVPDVPPMVDGKVRRSYVLWKESVKPLLVIEYVSGDGTEERDTTRYEGKFWVYEQGISAAFYAIFDVRKPSLELYCLESGRYGLVPANAAGRYPIEAMGIELGLWHGTYRGITAHWVRAWNATMGTMLPISEERADTAEGLIDETRLLLNEEAERAAAERKRANDEERRADAATLKAEESQRQAEDARRQAEDARHRADSAEQARLKLAEKLRALGIDPDS